jgi:hypothetical protein
MAYSDLKLDAAEVSSFLRKLEDIEAELDREEYPEQPFANGEIVPLDIVNKPWAQSYTYHSITHVGTFRLARNYTTDISLVEILFDEFTKRIFKWESGYTYSDDDIAAVARMGESIDAEKIYSINEAYNQSLNYLIAYGDPSIDMPGFINHPDALRSIAPFPINASSTPSQILGMMHDTVNSVPRLTKQAEQPNTLAMGTKELDYISNLIVQIGSTALNKTVLQQFLDSNRYIKDVVGLNELDAETQAEEGLGDKPIMISYRRDPKKLKAKIYQPLTFLESRRYGTDGWARPAKFKYGGVQLRRQFSMHIAELPA